MNVPSTSQDSPVISVDEAIARMEALDEAFLPVEVTVRIGERVSATLRGQRVDLATHPIERVVKAVTYHGLEVRKTKGGFEARVILDL